MFNRVTKVLLITVAVMAFFPSFIAAQTTAARPDRGIMPGASYSVSDIESINLTNGNLHVTIPLASLPPIAGGKLKLTLNAIYDSKLWNITRAEQQMGTFWGCPSWVMDTPQASDLAGWRIDARYRIVIRDAHDDFDYVVPQPPPTQDCETNLGERIELQNTFYRTILIGPDGAEHELRPIDNSTIYSGVRQYLQNYYKHNPNTAGAPMRYYSFDGSYLWAAIYPSGSDTLWTIYLNDGTQVVQYSNGIQRIKDTNGNSIKMFSDSAGSHIQDEQTDREIKIAPDGNILYQTVGGAWMTVTVNWGTTTVQGKLYRVNNWVPTGGETGGGSYCSYDQVLQDTLPVIREIIFPQTEPTQPAQRYVFNYNSDETTTATDQVLWACGGPGESYNRTVSKGLGGLSRMTTPSGAIVNYSYSKDWKHSFSLFGDTDDIARETVVQKQVTHDGVTDTWNYNIIEFNACGGTVTAPDGSINIETCYPKDAEKAQFFGDVPGKAGLVYRSNRSNTELIERHWTTMPFTGANQLSTGSFANVTFNPVVDAEYRTLLDNTPNHNPVKMAATTYTYDYNGNLLSQTDYDWFDPSLVSRDAQGVPTSVPAGATVRRVINHSYYNPATEQNSANVYAKRGLNTTPAILNAVKESTVGPRITRFSYDEQVYGAVPTNGNLTTQSVWDDLDAKWIITSSTYGLYGNIATTTDGRGKVTKYFFDDDTHALPNRVVVDPQNGTGTQTTTTVYDESTGLVTSRTDANGATVTIDYTNQLLGTVDPFGRPGVTLGPLVSQRHRVTTIYEDHLRRVIVASDLNAEDDQLLKTRTTTDMLGRPVLTEQTEDGTNYTLYSQLAYAQGGRISFASSVMRTGGSSNTDSWTRVTDDTSGRPIQVATFAGATQPPNTGTTSTATGTVTTVYDANFTTVTDQAGKLRRSNVDALGRLIRVDEPDSANNLGSTATPVQPTSYAYDVFDNLTTVTQGPQTRTFTYDSLSRLRQATNPESGTVSYQYDDNGNLIVKTDARTDPNNPNKKVSTHFEYDALNRLTRRWYNGSNSITATTHNNPSLPSGVGATDEARLYYDTALTSSGAPTYSVGSAKGRLVAQTYGTGANGDYYAYDALGRVTLKIQQTGTVNYQLSASYNLAGAISALTYPSGHSVTNTFDQAGRLTAFSGNLGDGANRTYATGILYAATGGLVKEQFGTITPVYNKLAYNSRGQLAEIRVSTSYTGPNDVDWNRGAIINSYSDQCTGICAGSSMTDNNGNLRKQEIYIPNDDQISTHTMRRQQYDYDNLNRLNSVREVLNGTEQWRQWFKYDRWGNRTIDTSVENGKSRTYGTGINSKAFVVALCNNSSDPCSNRLLVPAGQSGTMDYDAAGNLIHDTYTGAGNRTYDAENKITSAWGGNNQAQTYKYDASGQRIRRTVNGVETWQVYGFGGELLAEYAANAAAESPQKEYGYRNGQLLITAEAPPPSSPSGINVASSANGAVASASSFISPFVAGNAINGDRVGSASFWADDTPDVDDDWIQVQFAGSKTINEIDVFGRQNSGTPVEPTLALTSAYALTDFRVEYWTGSAWGTVPGADVTGNDKVWRKFTFAPLSTSRIRVYVTSVVGDNRSQVVEIEAYARVNVAAAGNGAIASASSAISPFVASNAINGDHVGSASFWADDTPDVDDDWIQVQFAGSKTISEIDVFGRQNSGTPVEPTLALTSAYALTDFRVEYWTGNAWATVPGAGVSSNDKVWRKFTFAPLTTSKIRVYVTSVVGDNRSQVVEIEAYTGSSSAAINWLVTDHLGTPRLILDQTGTLANVKRHDYLPFGEELFAPTGNRSAAQGYASGDGVRQQFTQQERDAETGLDFFGVRYYGSNQGRFTSTDPLIASGRPNKPQSWNRYAYVLNNPLILIDPDGMEEKTPEQQVVELGKDQNINKKIQEIQDKAKPLRQGTVPVPTKVVVIPGDQTQLNNATIIGPDGESVASGVTGYMQPIALVVLDQGGNIMKAPEDMFVVEDAKPANEAAEQIAKANRQVTSNQQERGQAKNGAFYDLQIRGLDQKPLDIWTTQNVTVRHYFGPRTTDYKEIFRITGNKIHFDDLNRRVTFTQGQVKKL